MDYEYGRIRKLAESLQEFGIAEDILARIMEGGEDIRKTTKPDKKAEWMKHAMERMDRLLDKETRCAVREACACCLGGRRHKLAKENADKFATLVERIAAADDAHFVFGNGVILHDDGSIAVQFDVEGKPQYRCVCLPKAKEPISITYCYCCGGHVKHHLQTALGFALQCTVRSSALSSGGKKPCTFVFHRRTLKYSNVNHSNSVHPRNPWPV